MYTHVQQLYMCIVYVFYKCLMTSKSCIVHVVHKGREVVSSLFSGPADGERVGAEAGSAEGGGGST